MEQHIFNSVVSEDDVSLFNGIRIVNSSVGVKCTIGDFSRITNSHLTGLNRIDRNTLIYFSDVDVCSYVGSNSVIMHSKIGKYCSLSWGITIGPANHDYEFITTHDFLYNDYYKIKPENLDPAYNRFAKKTLIGNDVWIGTNSTVLNGISIGDGAIIGANSIVTKDVPPYAIVVGNPGRIIKYRFSENVINTLLELKWWDLPRDIISDNIKLFQSKNIENLIEKLQTLK